jgi:predicted dienelactone hydrolase
MRMQRPILNSFLASGLALVVQGSAAQSVIPPLPTTGPYPVACTNVEQDLSRVSQGETASQYWRGVASGDTVRYVNALLVSPGNSLASTFTTPRDGELYDRWAGQPVSYVYLACYPTTAANARADYTLPGDVVVPRMQRGAEAPILPSSPSRLPVLLYSHGYGGSPLDGNYLSALVAFASWGYVTLAPFHGDLRYSVFGPDAWSLRFSIPVWDEFVAMQAIRPLSASAGLDVLLARAEWRDRVDTGRIGAFGISQGGETIALLAGAELTYGLFRFDSKRVTLDSRVRAGVGYIPYFGLDNLPAFGRDQEGVREFTMPFLALSGTDDSIAPQAMVRQAIDRMEGPRGHVLFSGQGHNLDPSSGADILTWALGFLDAWLNGNAAAKSKLTQVVSVEGGLDDRKEVYVDPTGGGGGGVGEVVDTIEYYNTGLDHYFITAFPDEAADLDAGGQVQGWKRTGYAFRSWKAGTGPGNDACRFFGAEGRGPNSHFYTISASECEKVKANADWTYEALAFRAVEPLSTGCAAEYGTVTRLYNNGMGGEANHRYLTDAAEIDRTVAKGWLVEGPVFCVPR